MSIRDFNNVIRKPGCIGAISVISLIAMGGGLFAGLKGCSNDANQANQSSASNTKPVIIGKVGEFQIDANVIQREYDSQAQRMAQSGFGSMTPAMMASGYGLILDQQVGLGLFLLEAKNKGIPLTDSDVRKMITDGTTTQIDQLKQQLIQTGKLKSSYSDADFGKAFEGATGQKYADFKSGQDAEIKRALSDPISRGYALAEVAQHKVPQALADSLKPSVDDLKSSYVTITAKRVLFASTDPEGDLAKAQAELKAGSSFESIIDKYTKDTTNKGRKPSETEITLTREQLLNPGPLHALLKMKAGEVSDPIRINDGPGNYPSLYKVIRIKQELPKDFDKQKDSLLKSYAMTLANSQLADDLKALRKSGVVTFTDQGWGALYDIATIDPNDGPAAKVAKLKEIVALTAKLVSGGGKNDQRPVSLAYYSAASELYQDAKPEDKAQYEADRIASIQAVASFASNPQDDLELSRLLSKKKDNEGAAQALLKAIEDNAVSSPNAAGITVSIQQAVQEMQKSKQISDDQVMKIQSEITRWEADKKQADDEQAQAMKAQQEQMIQQAKEKADFEKAQKEAADKAKASAPKGDGKTDSKTSLPSVTGPAPGSSTGATTGGTTAGPATPPVTTTGTKGP